MRLRHLSPLAIIVVIALVLLSACASAQAQTQTSTQAPSHLLSASEVVEHYFSILNAGIKSGNFSALNSVFASDATLTRSTLDGKTTVYHGLAEITGFYDTLPTKVPGFQWTTDSLRSPSTTVVLAYEHAGTPSMALPSRCAHVFVVQNGKIVSYDWVVFFAGQK
jgi:ketosteroid isomerase-like protein